MDAASTYLTLTVGPSQTTMTTMHSQKYESLSLRIAALMSFITDDVEAQPHACGPLLGFPQMQRAISAPAHKFLLLSVSLPESIFFFSVQ